MTSVNSRNAVVLLSGGLDSATTLAHAISLGFNCYALSFNYGQRHEAELNAAKKIADSQKCREHRIINLDIKQFGGSALTDNNISVPTKRGSGIPVTYVPARNTIFLSYALAWAEVLDIQDIFIGVNAVDYSGYPDCRPEYINAFQSMASLATRSAVENKPFRINAPLIKLTKAEIIKLGIELGVDYSITVSCYQADEQGRACGICDSCQFRKDGFNQSGISDPTRYQG